jgi:hypothetical protein
MGGGTGFYPQWTIDAAECGFTHIETFSFDINVPYSHEAWRYSLSPSLCHRPRARCSLLTDVVMMVMVPTRGRLRAMSGVAAALTPEQVARFDVELEALLREHAPTEPLLIPHRVWAMVATRPSPQSS